MTIFIIVCAAMLAAALLIIARPLLREKGAARSALPALAVILPAITIAFYWQTGHRTWEQDEAASAPQVAAQREFAATLAKLEERVREAPEDVGAMLTLGEALLAQDERAIAGRAGELFEAAVARAPDNTKALWYSAVAALSTGKLALGRERLQRVLKQNLPANIRTIVEGQIQAVDQQLNAAQVTQQAATSGPKLNVDVSITPAIAQEVAKSTSLFVLARDPVNGGPPLAAIRRTVADLPLSVTLSDNDAMVSGRGISSVQRVQIVARISKSGAPQAQPGDFFGDATVDMTSSQPIAVKIAIDRKVEK